MYVRPWIVSIEAPADSRDLAKIIKFLWSDQPSLVLTETSRLHALLIDNGWLEFDTINDYNLYSKMLNDKTLENLIKLNY